MGMTLKDAAGLASSSAQNWYNTKVKTLPIYQEIQPQLNELKKSEGFKTFTDIGKDFVTTGKNAVENLKNTETGRKASTMAQMFQSSEFGQKASETLQKSKISLSGKFSEIANMDISPVMDKAALYAQRAEAAFGGSTIGAPVEAQNELQ